MLTSCTRCAAPAHAADRFCRGCGLERSPLSTAVEQAFIPTAPPPLGHAHHTGHHTGRHTATTITPGTPGRGSASVDQGDGPDTVALRVTPTPAGLRSPARPPSGPVHTPRPAAPPPPTAAARPVVGAATWHVISLVTAGVLAALLLVETVLATSNVSGSDAAGATFLLLVLPRLVLTAGAVGVLVALAMRRAVAVTGAVALAAAVLAACLGAAWSAPGVFVVVLAIALAAVVIGVPLPRTPSPSAAVLAWWLAGAAVVAALGGFAYGDVAGRASSAAGGGVIFLLLGIAAVGCALGLRAGHAVAAWVLAGTWLLTLVAASLVGSLGPGPAPVVALHLVVAVVALASPSIAVGLGPGAVTARERVRLSLARVPRIWLLWGGLGLAVVAGLLLVTSGSSTGSSSGGGAGTGSTVMVVIVALLAFGGAFTPTLPWFGRAALVGGGGLALAIAWTGAGFSSRGSLLTWVVLLPLLLVGGCAWGAVVNHRHGVTSSRPGWAGPGGPPPPHPVPFLIPPTAGARSRVALHAETTLPPHVVLDAVRRTTSVRGNWFLVFGDEVEVEGTEPGVVGLHIGGHCHFRARVEGRGGRTLLRVGGMDRYLQSRSWYGFIPAGPAHVQGFWMYRLYLQTVAAELARLDPHARLAIAGPDQASLA